jgi:hypothetical protein
MAFLRRSTVGRGTSRKCLRFLIWDELEFYKLSWQETFVLSGVSVFRERSRSAELHCIDYGFRKARKPPLDAEVNEEKGPDRRCAYQVFSIQFIQ